MKVIAVNGSPRKNWNTATLLNKALEGATSLGAETELVHLYDLSYKGCNSCFSCKLKNGKSYGKCVVNDDLRPIFKRIEEADAIILGSPIYMGAISGEMKSFVERLLYPLFDAASMSTLFKKRIPTGFIYTMGATEGMMKELQYELRWKEIEMTLEVIFGSFEPLFAIDTYQFDDYSKYVFAPIIDPEEKAKRRKEEFPKDCQKAFEMGVRFAQPASRTR